MLQQSITSHTPCFGPCVLAVDHMVLTAESTVKDVWNVENLAPQSPTILNARALMVFKW
jgi:hypothetical protein